LAFVTALAADAQTQGRQLSANVPFDFIVGDKAMSAGQYRIGRITREADGAIVVSSADSGSNAMRLTNVVQAEKAAKQSTLVFHRYGDKYYLAQIWTAGNREGRELLKSKSQRALERQSASEELASNVKRETVTIVASME
jgi:hypothetical protein